MPIYTYMGNADPGNRVQIITVLSRNLRVRVGQSADFTLEEISDLRSWGYILTEGQLGPLQPPGPDNSLVGLTDRVEDLETDMLSVESGGVLGRVVPPSGDTTGATDPAAIAAALALPSITGGTQKSVILRGNYYLNVSIRLPSNTTLVLADAVVKVVDDAHTNCIQNFDQNGTGNTNIHVRGIGRAILDANVAGNLVLPTPGDGSGRIYFHRGSAVLFVNVVGFTIDGVTCLASRYSPFLFQICQHGTITRVRVEQDNSTDLQGAFEVSGSVNITIDGVTGTIYDDLISVSAFGTDSGFLTPWALTLTPAQRNAGFVTIRNVSVHGYVMMRVVVGDGSTVSYVTAQNIVNHNPYAYAPVLYFGPTQYVTTPPGPLDCINITLDGYDGPAQSLVACDSHMSNVMVRRARISNWARIVGHAALNPGFAPTIHSLTVQDVQASGTPGNVCELAAACVVNELNVENLKLRQCKAILKNACAIDGLQVRNVRIEDLIENPIQSSGAERGEMADVSWGTTSGSFTAILPATTKLGLNNTPTLKAVDSTPAAPKGARIVCAAGKDPTGTGLTTGGVYVGNGAKWIRQTDLGGWVPGDIGVEPLFWADASQVVGLADGAAVASLPELIAGSGITVSQGTVAKRPIWIQSVAALNNKSAIRFDGTDDFLQSAPFALRPQPITAFFVYLWRTVPTTGIVWDGSNSNASRPVLYKVAGGEALYAGSANATDGTPAANTPYLMTATFASSFGYLWRNQVTNTSTPVASGSVGGGGMDGITLATNREGNDPSALDLAEVIIYGAVLSAPSFTEVTSYLGTKYAITLT